MSVLNDIVGEIVDGVLREILRKPSSTAKRQTSRKRTVRTRSKARRRAR